MSGYGNVDLKKTEKGHVPHFYRRSIQIVMRVFIGEIDFTVQKGSSAIQSCFRRVIAYQYIQQTPHITRAVFVV